MSSVVGTTPLMFGCKRGLSQHLDFFFNVRTEFIIFTRILMVWQKKVVFSVVVATGLCHDRLRFLNQSKTKIWFCWHGNDKVMKMDSDAFKLASPVKKIIETAACGSIHIYLIKTTKTNTTRNQILLTQSPDCWKMLICSRCALHPSWALLLQATNQRIEKTLTCIEGLALWPSQDRFVIGLF